MAAGTALGRRSAATAVWLLACVAAFASSFGGDDAAAAGGAPLGGAAGTPSAPGDGAATHALVRGAHRQGHPLRIAKADAMARRIAADASAAPAP